MWFAIVPGSARPRPASAALSMTQFIAWRTWTSSNGGWVRFIVRYQVRSPEFWMHRCFRAGFVEYCADRCGGMLELVEVELPGLDLVEDVVGVRVRPGT